MYFKLNMKDNKDDFELLTTSEIENLEIEELESVDFFEKFFIDKNKHSNLPIHFRLVRRSIIFLFLLLISLFTISAIGNFQHFLDFDMKIILFLITCNSILLVFFSVIGFFEGLFCIFLKKQIKYLFYAISFLIPLLTAIVLGFFARTVSILSEGFLVS